MNDQQSRIIYCALSMFLYGLYTVLFSISMYILIARRHSSNIRKGLLTVNISLFTITTVSNILFFLWAYLLNVTAVVDLSYSQAKIERIISGSVSVTSIAITCVTDGLLVWRCLVVWTWNRWIIVLPVLLLISQIVFGVLLAVGYGEEPTEVFRNGPNQEDYFSTILFLGNSVGYILSFVTNTILTALIAGRIWWVDRQSRKFLGCRTGLHRRIILMIIESGAIYSFILLVTFALIITRNSSANIMNVVQSQTAGIFPTAIIVVVGLGMTMEHNTTITDTMSHMSFQHPERRRNSDPPVQFISLDVRRSMTNSTSPRSDAENQIKERDVKSQYDDRI
ncbi:hypothetical protein NEOLEDRAFT_1171491 [Neolentinus lepideus HHB14362 ss-1]|uniref:G-protein coupled receptors family 1 profile domain-containing protein n=1 Tax=Neolentinus lepideus HHB14362 ss-1 TaxID=1314782 RepID=A0A165QBG1_9AGAM|nr:hypothetical protein NEOLEDRAFT_1171491 [Neolentinus lepideus HHB14362 ss-1]